MSLHCTNITFLLATDPSANKPFALKTDLSFLKLLSLLAGSWLVPSPPTDEGWRGTPFLSAAVFKESGR